MLPPGHLAGAYLASYALLKAYQPGLDAEAFSRLLLLGTLAGFLPDLDTFWSFFKERSFTVRDYEKNDHRKYFSHAPAVWMLAGLSVFFLSSSEFNKTLGLLLWVGSWSHFFLDTIEHGIMWLWPFSSKRFVFIKSDLKSIREPGFAAYWLAFLKLYAARPSFYLEAALIISAILVFINSQGISIK